MAHQEHPSTSNSGNPPMVPALPQTDQGPNHTLAIQEPYASPNFSRTPAAVTGGMDASGFINALRRRWMLATFMGLLLAGGVGVGLYVLFPESDTAVARFLVKSTPTHIIYGNLEGGAGKDFDIFRATQLAQIKSHSVLQAALANPNLSNSKLLQEADNAVIWLSDYLDARFEGDSELMRVSLTETVDDDEELRSIVDAVCQAYMAEVVTKDRLNRVKIREALVTNLAKLRVEIRQKWDEYRQIQADLNIAEGQFDPAVRILFDDLSAKMKEKVQLESQLRQLQLQYATWKAYKDNPDLKEAQIDSQVAADPYIQYMEQEEMMYKAELKDAEKRSRGRKNNEIKRIETKMAQHREQMQAEKEKLRQEIQQQIANAPDIELKIYTDEFQRQLQFVYGRLKEITDGRDVPQPDGEVIREMGIAELKAELESQSEGSTDLLIRKAELEQLEKVASDLGSRVESWDIELQADPRIQLVEPAYILPGINKIQRYTICSLGSLATLTLTCLGIAYLEFLGRRLNGPKQLDEGLGIRVVGTLPVLKAKHQAQLTESIDSVRTALMHESTSKARQVVLVTSPRAMEGRTTVASQLAGSLARAGRRTLLVDGDLRRPALHTLFDVPLEDGLCEVLRAEAEVSDVVRATQAEGLWLMTAGYCDADAVHAMATDQIQPIFDKLRAEYDFVIIDGAPVLGLSDSLMMGQHCDGALLSVLRDYTTVPSIYQSSELLHSVGIRLIGSVVNGVSSKVDRRVGHLQGAAPKSNRKRLEAQPAEVGAAANVDDASDIDFGDLSSDDK